MDRLIKAMAAVDKEMEIMTKGESSVDPVVTGATDTTDPNFVEPVVQGSTIRFHNPDIDAPDVTDGEHSSELARSMTSRKSALLTELESVQSRCDDLQKQIDALLQEQADLNKCLDAVDKLLETLV